MGSRFDICQKCREPLSFREPDPCLGVIPDVAQACCGHGEDGMAYCCGFDGCKPNDGVQIIGFNMNGEEISERPGFWIKRGKEALEWMKGQRGNSSSQSQRKT